MMDNDNKKKFQQKNFKKNYYCVTDENLLLKLLPF